MFDASTFWPGRDERALLGRFYASWTLAEALAIIQPFEFAYLFLVMENPVWAVIPFFVANAVALALEIPTGLLADRFGRKPAVLAGNTMSAVSWALIPLAASLEGVGQLVAVCACLALDGAGSALTSGADDAWVVDNLESAGRRDLIDRYFARTHSFESFGGIVAGSLALAVLLAATVDTALLDLFWYVTAAGQIVAVLLVATVAERRPAGQMPGIAPGAVFSLRWSGGLGTVVRMRPLLFFVSAILIASFADSILDEAFVMSMITKGLDGRGLAPLGIFEDFVGLLAPLIGIALARRLGVTRFLSLFLVIPAMAVLAFLFEPQLAWVIALCLLFDACESLWDPVAEAHLQTLIPSRVRATVGSTVNQLSGLAELGGYGIFALMLGEHVTELREATPDLIDAFSGGVETVARVPVGPLGVPLTDLAIILFVLIGLLAVPFLVWARSAGRRDAVPANRQDPRSPG